MFKQGIFERATAVVGDLRGLVANLEPRCVRAHDAARLLSLLAEAERLAGVGKAVMARRVEETSLHKREGHRSAAAYIAAMTGTSVGTAGRELETARRLEQLPATSRAWRDGRLSELQAAEIASAAAADPSAEAELVSTAATKPLAELTERCRQVRAAAVADEAAHHEALHRSRHLRHWTGVDGAFRMDLRTTPEAGAAVLAGLAPFQEQILAEGRGAGRVERAEAHAADALVAMARRARAGDAPGAAKATVHVRVDASALERGHVEGNETCDIPGVGPVAVVTARALLGDAVVKLLVTRGVDVVSVLHLGRKVTAHQRSALEERDPTCVVAGCLVREDLEIDHVDGWTLTRVTALDRLARLCGWHHHLKTYEGYRLEGTPGHWEWRGPTTPSDTGPSPPDPTFEGTLFAG